MVHPAVDLLNDLIYELVPGKDADSGDLRGNLALELWKSHKEWLHTYDEGGRPALLRMARMVLGKIQGRPQEEDWLPLTVEPAAREEEESVGARSDERQGHAMRETLYAVTATFKDLPASPEARGLRLLEGAGVRGRRRSGQKLDSTDRSCLLSARRSVVGAYDEIDASRRLPWPCRGVEPPEFDEIRQSHARGEYREMAKLLRNLGRSRPDLRRTSTYALLRGVSLDLRAKGPEHRKRALRWLRRAALLASTPIQYAKAQNSMGVVLHKLGHERWAERAYRQAVAFAPDLFAPQVSLARIACDRRDEHAVEHRLNEFSRILASPKVPVAGKVLLLQRLLGDTEENVGADEDLTWGRTLAQNVPICSSLERSPLFGVSRA